MMAAACMLRPKRSRHAPSARMAALIAAICCPPSAVLFASRRGLGARSGSFLPATHLSSGFLMRLAVLALAALAALLLARRPVLFGAAVAAVAAIGLWSVQTDLQVLEAQRSFFGILRVQYDSLWNIHQLYHGTTSHGVQSLYADQRREPQGYYHPAGRWAKSSPRSASRRPPDEVGILGLGAGTIAAYAEPGEHFTFYEIDPAVERIASNPEYFTYLADCRGKTEVVLGDARRSLENGPRRQFDLMVLDVFSSDAVPLHLMTRQALQLYLRQLSPHGVLAFHISSRYFDLEPVLGRLAAEAGLDGANLARQRYVEAEAGRLVSFGVGGDGVASARPRRI